MAFYDRFRSLNCILALIELVSYLILHFDFRRSFCNCFFVFQVCTFFCIFCLLAACRAHDPYTDSKVLGFCGLKAETFLLLTVFGCFQTTLIAVLMICFNAAAKYVVLNSDFVGTLYSIVFTLLV